VLDMSLDDIIKKDGRKGNKSGRGGRGRRNYRSNGNGYGRQFGRGRQFGGGRQSGGGRRYTPYQHTRGGSVEDIALGPAQNRAVKVSSNSLVKKVAGAIAHCVRIGGAPPAVMCTGPGAINQAIKAIAIARRYLTDDEEENPTDIIAQPQFDGQSDQLVIRLRRSRPIDMSMDYSDLTATPGSDPYKVAGAIAGKIRDGERVGMNAVGANAVFHAVEAIAVSRTYLREDRIDIKFAPSFTKVDDPRKGECNAIHFATLSRRLN